MANTSRILCLPVHIIKLILKKLTEREDRRTCLTVCKLWKSIAPEYFAHTPIKVREDQLQKLLDDIPYFGHKVISIRINIYDNKLYHTENSIQWRDIVMMCPNLLYIYLWPDIANEFLTSLYSSQAELKKIRNIHIYHEPYPQSINIQIIHLKTAFRYRESITSLEMCSGDIHHASTNSSGLINFVQSFPNLTNLRIYCTDRSNVDINQILGAAPYLQVLKLYSFETITCVPEVTENGEPKENTHLAILKLKANRLDITSLENIATKLNQVLTRVINFRLVVYDEITPVMAFSNEIKTFIARIKRVKMEVPFRGKDHILWKGGELPSLSTSEIYQDHYPHNPFTDWHEAEVYPTLNIGPVEYHSAFLLKDILYDLDSIREIIE